MDEYIELSIMAKNAGGPEALIDKLSAGGFHKGMAVAAIVGVMLVGATTSVSLLVNKYKTQKAEELAAVAADAISKAEARSWCTVEIALEMQGDLTLKLGDKFRALTRDGDVIMIEIEGRADHPYFASGAQLETISDFKLTDIDDL